MAPLVQNYFHCSMLNNNWWVELLGYEHIGTRGGTSHSGAALIKFFKRTNFGLVRLILKSRKNELYHERWIKTSLNFSFNSAYFHVKNLNSFCPPVVLVNFSESYTFDFGAMYRSCPSWIANGKEHPTGPGGGAHQLSGSNVPTRRIPSVPCHARWLIHAH